MPVCFRFPWQAAAGVPWAADPAFRDERAVWWSAREAEVFHEGECHCWQHIQAVVCVSWSWLNRLSFCSCFFFSCGKISRHTCFMRDKRQMLCVLLLGCTGCEQMSGSSRSKPALAEVCPRSGCASLLPIIAGLYARHKITMVTMLLISIFSSPKTKSCLKLLWTSPALLYHLSINKNGQG